MNRGFCFDDDEHRREAQRDFSRSGRYGYDREQYRDPWDDCHRAYTEEFDRLRRDEDRRQEEREEREREEARYARRLAEERAMEEEEYYAQREAREYPEPTEPPQEPTP